MAKWMPDCVQESWEKVSPWLSRTQSIVDRWCVNRRAKARSIGSPKYKDLKLRKKKNKNPGRRTALKQSTGHMLRWSVGSVRPKRGCNKEVLTSLFIIFLQCSYVCTSLLVSSSLSTSFSVSVTLQLFRGSRLRSEVLDFSHFENLSYFEPRLSAVP